MMTSNKDFARAHQINHNKSQRICRLRDRISPVVFSDCAYFVTLTFRDEVFASTTADTRRQYVRKWCKSNFGFYVANIDYGDDKGREHYHAVVGTQNCNFQASARKQWNDLCGFLKIQAVKSTERSRLALPKYVVKLTSHAFKATSRRCYCIYSRAS